MAHSVTLSSLTESLITSLTGLSNESKPRQFRSYKDQATRSFKTHQHVRTNQFEVKARYDGLVEKFSILNREDLAYALSIRLKELADVSSNFTPEVLSLFLHLADRPVEKTNLEDLEALRPPASPPPLTWAEIVADDPLDEEIWDDIDYSAESSEDEKRRRSPVRSGRKNRTPPLSAVDTEDEPDVRSFVIVPDREKLQTIEDAQFWNHRTRVAELGAKARADIASRITELQAVREVLYMLRGLPTHLFLLDEESGVITCDTSYALEHAIPGTFHSLLRDLSDTGTQLYGLRQWTRTKQSMPLLQTLQASIIAHIRHVDMEIARIEQCFVAPEGPVTVSLVQVHAEIRRLARYFQAVAALINKVEGGAIRHAFSYLETLFDDANIAQMAGDSESFRLLAEIFFECLQTYLKPLRTWMEQGELQADDQIFFVGTSDKSSEASSLWHDRFVLRHGASGILHAPKFLHPAVRKIFNAGKSIVFLKELGYSNMQDAFPTGAEPSLDFQTVCSGDPNALLAPFSELFDAAFEEWIRSKYSVASLTLRQRLYDECGLWRSLDALEYIYLSRDGTLFQTFADGFFEKVDGRRRVWNDRFLLTELEQTTFSGIDCVHEDLIAIRVINTKHPRRSVKTLSSILVDYMLPWSITNVVRKTSFKTYQRVFTFLLQVYRAKYLLRALDLRSTLTSPKSAKHTHLICYIRYRMLWFADLLHSYLTETVIASSTTEMRKRMAEAEDIDAMAAVHEDFINRLRLQCLLSKNVTPIFQAIISLLDLCILFSDTLSQLSARPALALNLKRPALLEALGRRRSSKRAAMREPDEESISESDSEDGYEAEAEKAGSVSEGPLGERLEKMREQFERLCGFVAVGVKGVGRAGAEPAWGMLAERLEWGGGRAGG